jgi:hypothetical protein
MFESGRFLRILGFLAITTFLAPANKLAAEEIEWEPTVYPKDNFFPALVLGTARVKPEADLFAAWEGNHLGDPQGVVGVFIAGLKKGDELTLKIEENSLMRATEFTGKAPKTDDLTIYPKVSYHYDKLAAVKEATPFDITMELLVNGKSLGKKPLTVTLRAVNDCLFGVEEETGDNSDYSWLFAAYVNENHPWVDRILKKALESGIVESFDGYQSGTDEAVLLQIFAIWHVMQELGMRYSDITTTAAEEEGVYSQHVRLFDESVEASQANCVDGSVLLGAVLRKIGLGAYLVLVPGHMYLAVDLNPETVIGIETTLMGQAARRTARKLPGFDQLSDEEQEASWASFEQAVAVGTEDLESNFAKFEAGDSLQYQVIDIAMARQAGILPIRFGNSNQ